MIKVYFGTPVHSELAAIFENEEIYMACLPALEEQAKKMRMSVVEVVTYRRIEDWRKS